MKRILNAILRPFRSAKRFMVSAWSGWDGKKVDLHVYGGLALLATGLWLMHPGAALAIAGALLFYVGLRAV